MRINIKNYLEAAKKYQVTPYYVTYKNKERTNIEFYNGEVESQEIGHTTNMGAYGMSGGKRGSYATDHIDKNTPELLAKNVHDNALYGREDKPEYYFKGGAKYKRIVTWRKDFVDASLSDMKKVGKSMTEEAKALDPRVSKVEISLTKLENQAVNANDQGLYATKKRRSYHCSISVICEDETGESKTGGRSFSSRISLDDLIEKSHSFIKEAVKSAVDFFHTGPVKSGNYKVLLHPYVFGDLIGYFLDQLDAKSVQKHLSLFEGKIGQQIISKKITFMNTPHNSDNMAASSYDSEGVPTQKFCIIKNGILMNYFYSLQTAYVDKVQSNGCAIGTGGNGSYDILTVKPGKKTFDELLLTMKDGLYITDLNGLNSGIDSQTLDFSLPCEGYLVKDGKIDKAVSMIIIAGNLKDLFMNITAVGSDVIDAPGLISPSILIKKAAISG